MVPQGGCDALVSFGFSQYLLLAGHSDDPFSHSTNLSPGHVLATILGPGYTLVTVSRGSPPLVCCRDNLGFFIEHFLKYQCQDDQQTNLSL